jgi:hypothetical protein
MAIYFRSGSVSLLILSWKHRSTTEYPSRDSLGNTDKNENPLKFSRDMESDGAVKNGKPHMV